MKYIKANKGILIVSLFFVAILAAISLNDISAEAQGINIRELLADKPAAEKADIKGREIAKSVQPGQYDRGNLDIEIVGISSISGGVQIFVRAWQNGKQIGFGKDGTVDIERFRIFNPPILVPDENGDIVQEWTDDITGELHVGKLREDPEEALLQSLEHTISVMKNKHGSENIVQGKRGNTTLTAYPAAGANAPVDGDVYTDRAETTFAALRSADPGDGANVTDTNQSFAHLQGGASSDTFLSLWRYIAGFDTSSIGSDMVDSATFSLYTTSLGTGQGDTDVDIVSASPASASNLVVGDYAVANFGTTRLATGIAISTMSTSQYTNFTLNASGLAAINGSGNTFLATLLKWDVDNSYTGTWGGGFSSTIFRGNKADQTGTTQDPTLVVEHSATNAVPTAPTSLLSEGQTNPASISDPTPEFSAVYNDPNASDSATQYRLQVSTSSIFSSVYWDSGTTTMATTTEGSRSPDISYAGSALASSTTYYWRIRFFDVLGTEGAWSTETATFSLAEPEVLRVRKAADESLQSSATLQDDNHLALILKSDRQYIVDGILFVSASGAGPDLKISFTAPTGATLTLGYLNNADRGFLTAGTVSPSIAIPGGSTVIPIHVSGTVVVGSTAGDVTLRWAQNSSNANATTIHAGSYIRAEEI